MNRDTTLWGQVRTVAVGVFFCILFITAVEWLTSTEPVPLERLFSVAAVTTICCAIFCSLLLFGLFDRILNLPRLAFFVLFTLLVASGVALGVAVSAFILTGRLRLYPRIFLFSLIIGLVFSGVMSGYFVFRFHLEQKISRIKEVELENEKLRRIETETRLRDLQAKLNPHFLFNALNSTAALIYDDPRRAERSVERLSGLYRRVLDHSSQSLVGLGEELRLVEDYLELEKLRFDEKLAFEISCPDELLGTLVPAFIVEPLVENSIKHGSAEGTALRIEVRVRTDPEGRVLVTVADNGPGFEAEKTGAGFGLYSIQERLRLQYGERASLDIDSAGGRGTVISIRLPRAPA